MEQEYRIVRPSGEIRRVRAQERLARDAAGRPERIDGILTDVTEQERAQEQIKRRIEQLTALRAIDIAISSSLDLNITLNVLMQQVISVTGIDATDILRLDPYTQMLEYTAGRGFRTTGIARSSLRLGQGLAGRAALERRLIHIPTYPNPGEPLVRTAIRRARGSSATAAYRCWQRERSWDPGGLSSCAPHTGRGLAGTAGSLAGQAAIAIDNSTLFDGLQRSNSELIVAYDSTLEGWSRALDLRDKETQGHTQRVTELAVRLAEAMGMNEEQLVQVRRGALLHDVGKLGIPDQILLKPGALTAEEWEVMRLHPVYAYEWLSPIAYLRAALDIPYCHHEKWDGSGYPRGLRGEQIPLAARVFAVVDVWDALLSDRPYRSGWPVESLRTHPVIGRHPFRPKGGRSIFSDHGRLTVRSFMRPVRWVPVGRR